MQSIGIIGAGSFGTALAHLCAEVGLDTRLWCRREDVQIAIARERQNPQYLGDLELASRIAASCDLDWVCQNRDALLFAVPSQHLRGVLQDLPALPPGLPLILAAKGIEARSLLTMDQVVVAVLGENRHAQVFALSGPSFAREIVERQPTAVVIAGADESEAKAISEALFCPYFRAYVSTDLIGVEVGGALKNVMAIAAGGLVGMGFGKNTQAALITRGLAEITRLAVAMGAHPMTLAGLSGMGDLVLTCGSAQSRNQRTGVMLGKGHSVAAACERIGQVVEGIETARSAHQLAQKLEVEVPIISAVHAVLYKSVAAKDALRAVIERPPSTEF